MSQAFIITSTIITTAVLPTISLVINCFYLERRLVVFIGLQQPMQAVPITTDVVGSNLDQGEVYNIM
jgi:hypothetical protein